MDLTVGLHFCVKSLWQGKHLLVVQYRQPGPDVPVTSPSSAPLSPSPCPFSAPPHPFAPLPHHFVPSAQLCPPKHSFVCPWALCPLCVILFQHSTRSLAGQLAARVKKFHVSFFVLRQNTCCLWLHTAVALNTAPYLACSFSHKLQLPPPNKYRFKNE